MSHETIYQSLFVQGRGALRTELTRCLRTGRAQRRPQGRPLGAGQLKDMVLISDRPAEVDDRAIPGHWEGDLMLGKHSRSAIGTLVERQTRFVMLVRLPRGRLAVEVKDALVGAIRRLPAHLRRSLTWDQGKEMGEHVPFTIAGRIKTCVTGRTMRRLTLLCLWGIVGGCHPIVVASITVFPSPMVGRDSVAIQDTEAKAAMSLASRLATGYGLEQQALTGTGGFDACFVNKETLQLCMKLTSTEVSFRLTEILGASKGEPLRRALADSLRNRFGESRVRVSEWH